MKNEKAVVFKKDEIIKQLENLAVVLTDIIGRDLWSYDDELRKAVLAAYNRMRDDEFDGSEYIFDFCNNEDIKYLISHDCLTFEELYDMRSQYASNFFFLKRDASSGKMVCSECSDLYSHLHSELGQVVRAMLVYPQVAEYNVLYNMYVTELCGGTDFFK